MDIHIARHESKKVNQEHAEAILQDFGKIKENKRTLVFRMDFPKNPKDIKDCLIETQFLGCPMTLPELESVLVLFSKCMMQSSSGHARD